MSNSKDVEFDLDDGPSDVQEFDLESANKKPIPYVPGNISSMQSKLPSLRELVAYDIEVDNSGMPMVDASLRRKQTFVIEFFERGSIAEAYRAVYDPKVAPTKALVLAQQLVSKDQFIRDLISIARQKVETTTTGLLAEHCFNLAAMRDMALRSGKFTAAVASEIQRGKALGLYDGPVEPRVFNAAPVEDKSEMVQKVLEHLMELPYRERKNIADMLLAGK